MFSDFITSFPVGTGCLHSAFTTLNVPSIAVQYWFTSWVFKFIAHSSMNLQFVEVGAYVNAKKSFVISITLNAYSVTTHNIFNLQRSGGADNSRDFGHQVETFQIIKMAASQMRFQRILQNPYLGTLSVIVVCNVFVKEFLLILALKDIKFLVSYVFHVFMTAF